GTMIQMALRPVNFFAKSSSDETPTLPDAVSFCTASALKSKPITWCPPRRSRSAMLPPILPRPINPSCMSLSLLSPTSIHAQGPQIAPQLFRAVEPDSLYPRRARARHVLLPVVNEQNALRRRAQNIERAPIDGRLRLPQAQITGTQRHVERLAQIVLLEAIVVRLARLVVQAAQHPLTRCGQFLKDAQPAIRQRNGLRK